MDDQKSFTNREKLRRVFRGAAGLSKSIMSINKAPDEIIQDRLKICRECEFSVGPRSYPERKVKCKKCGCLINHKVRLKNSFCPIGKWKKYTEI